MHWMDAYRARLTSAEEAVSVIRSGHQVFVHQGCSQPETLLSALMARAHELRGVRMIHMATMGAAEYAKPAYEGVFRHLAFFIGANVRQAVQESRADYVPIFLSEIEGLFTSGIVPLDVALVQCTPPDDYGYMSLGAGVDITLTAARTAKHVIVQMNDQAPRTMGNCHLHVSEVDALVECSHPLPEYRRREATDLHHTIARYIAELVPDGATLQTGIGEIPDAVLASLKDHRDLGVHAEMCSDGVVDLIQCGAVNNRRKSLHPNKVVLGFVLGTKRLFDFLDNNPAFDFHPTAYTNDPFVIAQNDRMVAINSAIEVDLTGQVCSDSVGTLPYSGFGGQVDFIRGAARSKEGVPIIALPSTAKKGTLSRIVPMLKPGAGVVTSRADVHYVVTEYGVAALHGRCLRERTEALIQIAHPDFREDLMDQAREMGLLDRRHALSNW
jgi:4-hydroxybutyrate CoA-transferase